MNVKNIIGVLLLVFALAGLLYLGFKSEDSGFAANNKAESQSNENLKNVNLKNDKPATTTAKAVSENKGLKHVVVYYFHTTHRCMTCNRIEELTKEVIGENYPGQLADESLLFKSLNTDLEPNKHYLKDFDLYTKSLVITIEQSSDKHGSDEHGAKVIKWKNCPEIWELVHRPESFEKYIKGEVDAYLREL